MIQNVTDEIKAGVDTTEYKMARLQLLLANAFAGMCFVGGLLTLLLGKATAQEAMGIMALGGIATGAGAYVSGKYSDARSRTKIG